MSGTLAYNMRPQSLLDILGQKHIIGKNGLFTKFVEKNHPMSVILYGPPGCGKTTLAMALAHDLNMPCRTFNASTGNKKEMDLIIEEAKLSNGLFVIIDEIHRMNKMKQDNLLPYVESGLLIIVGCTTANPYHSINPAIRSRCQIIEVKPLTHDDIIQGLHRALDSEKGYHHLYQCDEEVLQHIARLSSGDIRFAYNCLEVCTIISHDNHITIEDAKNALTQANGQFDKDEDQYYDTLSGLQKSIRGSDPNGAMYYFAKLIEYNDIESLERRVLVCAYEDVGLANPNACMRTVAAFQAARTVGFPEARIPIASQNPDIRQITQNKKKVIVLNKCDLADEKDNQKWREYFIKKGCKAVLVDSNNGLGINEVIKQVQEVMIDEMQKHADKGRKGRKIRAMIVGIPNVGKSSFINRIAKKNSAGVANRPGVTKQKQWIRINDNIELMDTPGVLWPKFENEEIALNLAYTGTIKDDILAITEIAYSLTKFLLENYRKNLLERYSLDEQVVNEILEQDQMENENIYEIMQLIGKKRGAIISGGNIDDEKTSKIILDDFRSGKLGRITIEKVKRVVEVQDVIKSNLSCH